MTITLDAAAARHNALVADLERMVDAATIEHVISALSQVAYAKSAHILENWQDGSTALKWDRVAKSLDRAAGVAIRQGV